MFSKKNLLYFVGRNENSCYNETPLVATVEIKDEDIVGINKPNWKEYLEVNKTQRDYFYFPLTVEEYNTMGNNIKCIDGQLRMPTWSHVTGVATLGHAANLLAYRGPPSLGK